MGERGGGLQEFPHGLGDDERGELIYGGAILVFKQVPALTRLVRLCRQMLTDTFPGAAPVHAQTVFPVDRYIPLVDDLQQRFNRDPEVKTLLCEALEHVGVVCSRTYWDRIHLRVVPYGGTHSGYQTRTLHHHRDTWASNVYQQVNWWTPVYTLTAERTIALYPRYWSTAIENSSASWDLTELRRAKQAAAAKHLSGFDYPVVARPLEPVDTSDELPVVIQPGDLLGFSAAHLHATVPNTTDVARFSIEFRTVSVEDFLWGRGAPNVDGRAPYVASSWFRHMLTGSGLDRHPVGSAASAL